MRNSRENLASELAEMRVGSPGKEGLVFGATSPRRALAEMQSPGRRYATNETASELPDLTVVDLEVREGRGENVQRVCLVECGVSRSASHPAPTRMPCRLNCSTVQSELRGARVVRTARALRPPPRLSVDKKNARRGDRVKS